jgi:hypothetical protein
LLASSEFLIITVYIFILNLKKPKKNYLIIKQKDYFIIYTYKNKRNHMKKLMFIFGITLALASCTSKPAETTTTTTDSTAVAVDTLAVDTTHAVVDSTKK